MIRGRSTAVASGIGRSPLRSSGPIPGARLISGPDRPPRAPPRSFPWRTWHPASRSGTLLPRGDPSRYPKLLEGPVAPWLQGTLATGVSALEGSGAPIGRAFLSLVTCSDRGCRGGHSEREQRDGPGRYAPHRLLPSLSLSTGVRPLGLLAGGPLAQPSAGGVASGPGRYAPHRIRPPI